MRAWDVVWGSVAGSTVIQNNYVDVSDVVITSGESRIRTRGRFSIGFPRADGGEEINARIEIVRRPVADLRHAFTLDEYDIRPYLQLDTMIAAAFDCARLHRSWRRCWPSRSFSRKGAG